MRIDKQATPVNVVGMKQHLRLYNPMPVVMGFQGKVYVETPNGMMPLSPSAVSCVDGPKNTRLVVTLAKYVVAKNGWWHLVRKN
jgi:hypothetical protein